MKKIILFLLMTTLIFASGCITEKPTTSTFVGGTKGLDIKFQNLPSVVGPGVTFPIIVYVENTGETTVWKNTTVFVLNNAQNFNIEPQNVIITNAKDMAPAKKIGDTVLQGDVDVIVWPNARFTGKVLTEEQKIPIVVSACYPYNTAGIVEACVTSEAGVCNPNEEKPIQSSGAPIQFTKFSQHVIPSANKLQIYLTTDVANKGDGIVFPISESCFNPLYQNQDMLNITSMRLGNRQIDVKTACGDTTISLYKGSGTISCNFEVPATEDFSEQLIIGLAYKYKQTIAAEIAITPK